MRNGPQLGVAAGAADPSRFSSGEAVRAAPAGSPEVLPQPHGRATSARGDQAQRTSLTRWLVIFIVAFPGLRGTKSIISVALLQAASRLPQRATDASDRSESSLTARVATALILQRVVCAFSCPCRRSSLSSPPSSTTARHCYSLATVDLSKLHHLGTKRKACRSRCITPTFEALSCIITSRN